MFEKLKSKTNKVSKSKSTSRKEMPRTIEFVRALVSNEFRLSYAALADAAAALGEHTPTGLSAGQRGSAILKSLPAELQPHVCRGNGGYAKGQEWPDVEVPANLRSREYVRPERILSFVAAFEEATATSEESETDQPEIEPSEEELGEIAIEEVEDETDVVIRELDEIQDNQDNA